MMMKVGAFLLLALVLMVPGAAAAGSGCCAIDARRTYVIEARHMMHLVLVATSVDWRKTKKELRPALRSKLMSEARWANCQVLKSTNKLFKYIKHPKGYVQIEMRDRHDALIGSTRVRWKSC